MSKRYFCASAIKPLKIYLDLLSQPARALKIFLNVNAIPHEEINLNLGRGDNTSPEFAKINPFKKIPVIDDNGFVLSESVAIFRHLCRTCQFNEQFYPRENISRARVDEYLEWQHLRFRSPLSMYVWAAAFDPVKTGQPTDDTLLKARRKQMIAACDDLNDVWLKNKPFVAGDNVTFADILAACELMQLTLTDYDPKEERPAVTEWLKRVQSATNPFFDEAHVRLHKVNKKTQEKLAELRKNW